MYIEDINCPCCQNKVGLRIYPGERPVYYPNDKAHPGSPPVIEDIEGCECWEWISSHGDINLYEDQLWDSLQGARGART